MVQAATGVNESFTSHSLLAFYEGNKEEQKRETKPAFTNRPSGFEDLKMSSVIYNQQSSTRPSKFQLYKGNL